MTSFLLLLTFFAHLETVTLRGHPQEIHVYGDPHGRPAIVASGDGGWIRLAPAVAERLAAHGFFVIGLDSRAYLRSFTRDGAGVSRADVAADFAALLARLPPPAGGQRPVLVGVSEGAALSILAATDRAVQSRILGVVALGVGDLNELAWRWIDAVIYITKGVPNEPTFSVASVVPRATVPLAMVQSTRDEYVPGAETDSIFAAAPGPKRLWRIDAADHRFSNNIAALHGAVEQALAWIRASAAH